MMNYELDSVETKNPELIRAFQVIENFDLNKSIFIVGDDGTGRSTLAEKAIKSLTEKGGLYSYKKNIESLKEITNVGVYTVLPEVWKIIFSKLPLNSFYLIHMPTLAERKMDLPALAKFSVSVLGLMYARPHITLTSKAIEKILQYNWPGQFIEMESVLETAVSQNTSGFIEPEDLKIQEYTAELEMPIGLKLEELEENIFYRHYILFIKTERRLRLFWEFQFEL